METETRVGTAGVDPKRWTTSVKANDPYQLQEEVESWVCPSSDLQQTPSKVRLIGVPCFLGPLVGPHNFSPSAAVPAYSLPRLLRSTLPFILCLDTSQTSLAKFLFPPNRPRSFPGVCYVKPLTLSPTSWSSPPSTAQMVDLGLVPGAELHLSSTKSPPPIPATSYFLSPSSNVVDSDAYIRMRPTWIRGTRSKLVLFAANNLNETTMGFQHDRVT